MFPCARQAWVAAAEDVRTATAGSSALRAGSEEEEEEGSGRPSRALQVLDAGLLSSSLLSPGGRTRRRSRDTERSPR